ncbi:MAG: hypothetical protein V8S24_00090 [Gordonibacter pamelaeae]
MRPILHEDIRPLRRGCSSRRGCCWGFRAGWLAFSTEVLGSVTLPVMVVVVVMFFIFVVRRPGVEQAELFPGESQEPAQHIVIGPRGRGVI